MNSIGKNTIRFLRWFCKEELLDELEGDIVELHKKRSVNSKNIANLQLFLDVLRCLRFSNIKRPAFEHRLFLNLSLKQSFRYVRRENIYSILNVSNLAIGAAFFILFSWYAIEELSFDQFHSEKEYIYRVSFEEYLEFGPYATTSYPVGPAIKQEFPEVKYMSRFGSASRMIVRYGETTFFEKVNVADEDFFRMFDFDLLAGNTSTVLDAPNKIVISQELAHKYFGDDNPIGQTLELGSSGSYNSLVTGVFKNVPSNSQLQFDILLSYKTQENLYDMSDLWTQMPANYTYLTLHSGVNPKDFERKLSQIKDKYVTESDDEAYKLELIPLTEVHFTNTYKRELDTQGNRQSLVSFGIVSLVILLIGIFNFVNLTSSRFLIRVREMGIRKVMGANRADLIGNLMLQSGIVIVSSLLTSLLVVFLLLPFFNELAGSQFSIHRFIEWDTLLMLAILFVFNVLIAGVLPAIGITNQKVTSALKFKKASVSSPSSFFKKSVLFFQYGISLILLISSLVIYQQMDFIHTKISDKDESVKVIVRINSKIRDKIDVIGTELTGNARIHEVAASSHVPSFYGDSWPVKASLNGDNVQTENFVITDNYPELMSYELVAGRWLDQNLASDRKSGFVVNETLVGELGFSSPEEAIGEVIYFGGDDLKQGTIVGVSRDFHFESFHNKINPAIFQFSPYDWMGYNFLILKTSKSEINESLSILEDVIKKIDEKWVVEGEFFDQHFRQFHMEEIRQGQLSVAFSIVAILLSCLGQIGLLMNGILGRRKEIAIRKVLGAKVNQLWFLLTNSYISIFVVSTVVAIPIAWVLVNRWLDTFQYHIHPGFGPFIVSTFVTGLILMAVVSVVTLSTSNSNPVDSLSDE